MYSIFITNTIYIDSKQKQTHIDAANSATSWTLDPVGYAATVGVVVRCISIVVDCLLPLVRFVLRSVVFLCRCGTVCVLQTISEIKQTRVCNPISWQTHV